MFYSKVFMTHFNHAKQLFEQLESIYLKKIYRKGGLMRNWLILQQRLIAGKWREEANDRERNERNLFLM